MKRNQLPSLERLESLLRYDPETGNLFWLPGRKGARRGRPAGSIEKGYIRITIDGIAYMAHRIAWKMHHRADPPDTIDHRNGDGCGNRPEDLREATPSGNIRNRRDLPYNTSGFRGIVYYKRNRKWAARIADISLGRYKSGDAKKRWLGMFDTPEQASAAYERAAATIHGEFYYRRGVGK